MVSYSTQKLDIGTQAPDISLPNTLNNEIMHLSDINGPALIFWTCNHCPFAIHVQDYIKTLADEFIPKGISFVAINSNSTQTHPQDGPEHMKALVTEKKWSFPFLFDETQEVAKRYGAACTPDFFLFNQNMKLHYRGQLDGSRPENGISLTGKDLRNAFNSVLSKGPPPEVQRPSAGCSIKWHPS